MKLGFVILAVVFLSSCQTLPTSQLPRAFTTENIMRLHPGMGSDEILSMFGNPKSVRQAVCGGEDPWVCTTWEYGKSPYDHARFTFSGLNPNELILNNFEVNRD